MAEPDEMKFCRNCKRDIASANFVMHEVHCLRNIVLCPACQEPVHKAELDAHTDELHALIACDKCGVDVERPDMEKHVSDACAKRLVRCDFCEMDKTFDSLEEHKQYCGTRTEECPICHQYVMKKDQLLHDQSNCQYPEPKDDGPSNNENQPAPFGGINRLNTFAMNEISRITNPDVTRHNNVRIRNDVTTSVIRNDVMGKNETRWRTEKNLRAERTNVSRGFDENAVPDNNVAGTADWEDHEDEQLQLALQLSRQAERPPDNNWLGADFRQQGREKTRLPCEFCYHLYPSDDLIQHQSGCTGSLGTETALQARARGRTRAESEPLIHTHNTQEWIRGTFPEEFVSNDDVMLPCEFCDDVFPEEFLVQHQAVCEKNRCDTAMGPRRPDPSRPKSPPRAPRAPERAPEPRAPQGGLPYKPRHRPTGPSANAGADSQTNNTSRGVHTTRRSSYDSSRYEPSFVTSAPRRTPANQRTNVRRPGAATSSTSAAGSDMSDVNNRMGRSSLEPTIQPRNNNIRPRNAKKP